MRCLANYAACRLLHRELLLLWEEKIVFTSARLQYKEFKDSLVYLIITLFLFTIYSFPSPCLCLFFSIHLLLRVEQPSSFEFVDRHLLFYFISSLLPTGADNLFLVNDTSWWDWVADSFAHYLIKFIIHLSFSPHQSSPVTGKCVILLFTSRWLSRICTHEHK